MTAKLWAVTPRPAAAFGALVLLAARTTIQQTSR